jgi:hypothetical protein
VRIADVLSDFYEKNKVAWREKTAQTYHSKMTIFLAYAEKEKIVTAPAVTRAAAEKFIEHLRVDRQVLPQTRKKYAEFLHTAFKSFVPDSENPWKMTIKKVKPVAALYYQPHQKKILKWNCIPRRKTPIFLRKAATVVSAVHNFMSFFMGHNFMSYHKN